jgi:hypothetical protein
MPNVYNLHQIIEIIIVLPTNGKAPNAICHVVIHLWGCALKPINEFMSSCILIFTLCLSFCKVNYNVPKYPTMCYNTCASNIHKSNEIIFMGVVILICTTGNHNHYLIFWIWIVKINYIYNKMLLWINYVHVIKIWSQFDE